MCVKYVIEIFQAKKNEKLRNYLFKMKELSKTVFGKDLFISIKEHLF